MLIHTTPRTVPFPRSVNPLPISMPGLLLLLLCGSAKAQPSVVWNVTTIAGNLSGVSGFGDGTAASFYALAGVAIDGAGTFAIVVRWQWTSGHACMNIVRDVGFLIRAEGLKWDSRVVVGCADAVLVTRVQASGVVRSI